MSLQEMRLYCCIVLLYCIMRPYTDGPIGPLSYRHSSGVVRNPHSTLAKEGSLTCDPKGRMVGGGGYGRCEVKTYRVM